MNGSVSVNWNMTSTNSSEESTFSTEVKTLPLIITFIMCVVIITTNLLVLIVLFYKPHTRQNHRIEFILWLCLSDIIVGISGLLFVFNYVIKDLSTNEHYCSLMYHFIIAGIGQSLAHTFLICLDRHMAVVANIRYKMFSKKYRYIVIFGTWFFIHVYIGTLVVVWLRVDSITYCSLNSFPNHNSFLAGANVLYLPLLVIIPCLYISTIINFKNRSNRIQHYPNIEISANSSQFQVNLVRTSGMSAIRQNYEKQVIVTTGLVVVTLLFLSGPFIIVVLFLEGGDIVAISRSTRIFITIMIYLNSAVNPILYSWRIRKFRQTLLTFICPCKTPPTQEH